MNNLMFKFYSVLKNEDAMPYIGGNLLVAADGLGGSGSAVHQIDRTKHIDMGSEILSAMLGDVPQISCELLPYIEELIAPMIDGKDDTSALWASRIVIARCVYALTEGEFKDAKLDDKKVRADLAEFISKGLHRTVERFDLKNGKYDNQLLLPTTLAFIRYTEQEHSVITETIWAGDSRLYALTPTGLKLLSVDDEDDSGSITNLFYADNKKIRFNYLRHELQKPCILMAVSDGIFDPFDPHDHLGVEHTLLSAVAESNSEQELAEKLHGFFDSVHGDDATMAFVSFGFADFADMKIALKARTEKILSIRQRQAEMYSALEVMNMSEEDASHYVVSRTGDRYDYIIPMLIDAIERGVDDIAITTDIRSMVEGAHKAYKIAAETARRERREVAFAELNKYVLSHPELVVSEILTSSRIKFNDQNLADLYFGFVKAAEDLALQLKRGGELGRYEGEFAAKKQHLHELIQAKIIEYRKLFDDLWNEPNPEVAKNRIRVFEVLRVWYGIDNALKLGWGLQDIGRLPLGERDLAYAVQDFNTDNRSWRSNIASCRNTIDRIRSSYEKLWRRLFEHFKRSEKTTEVLLSSQARQKFGLDESGDSATMAVGKGNRDGLLREFKAGKVTIVSSIVKSLAQNCTKTSIIDGQYNGTKLELFRTYYRLRNNPNNGIKEFEGELLALESEYTSLVSHA